MKKLLSPLLMTIALVSLFFASCMKDDDSPVFDEYAQYKADSIALRGYVAKNFPEAVYHNETGIWYEILTEGQGDYEYKIVDTLNGKFLKFFPAVKYVGKLLNGTTFDQTDAGKIDTFEIRTNTAYQYPFASSIIPAWTFAFAPEKIGEVKLGGLTEKGLQKGSKVHIMAPSRYGYGNRAVGPIPANSPLDFVIEVVDIK